MVIFHIAFQLLLLPIVFRSKLYHIPVMSKEVKPEEEQPKYWQPDIHDAVGAVVVLILAWYFEFYRHVSAFVNWATAALFGW